MSNESSVGSCCDFYETIPPPITTRRRITPLPARNKKNKRRIDEASMSITPWDYAKAEIFTQQKSAFTCPPLPNIKRIELDGAGVIEPFGSLTDPKPKYKKRSGEQQESKCEDFLPQDFINYWKEHYKKVDEFELIEEEVLYSELD